MRRFFGTVNLADHTINFTKDTLKHIKVIRLEIGEKFEVVSQGRVFLCQVKKILPFQAEVIKECESDLSRELRFSLILLCPLLKKNNFELVLQKSVELGVSEIYPFVSSRVIKRVTREEFSSRKARFEKIISGAAEQSNRTSIPILHELSELQELSSITGDRKYIAYENEAIKGKMISKKMINDSERVICLLGPEGGFASSEVELFLKKGFEAVSLGKRILRAETAALYMLSVLSFLGENKDE